MPTFGSLFSGIGGLDLGLQRAGWHCHWQIEKNDFRRSILARHWPSVNRYSDIREVDFDDVEPVDLIAGGFPCQPVSSAGKRQAQDDERWLWPEFARAIRALRPRFALIENVAGLLQRGFGDVLSDLAASGYDAEWQMLPACAFGAPHTRQRIWIVAYPHCERCGAGSYIRASEALVFGRRIAYQLYEARGTSHHWSIEPGMVRMVHGFSNGMGRYVSALGDSVVPELAEFIGRLILEAFGADNEAL